MSMPLTKTDFNQIRKILREESEEENETTRTELRSELKLFRVKLENQLEKVENGVKNLSIRLRKVEKDISVAIDVFDRTDIKLDKRVEKIEDHLGLSTQN